jgi:hypothetical protein
LKNGEKLKQPIEFDCDFDAHQKQKSGPRAGGEHKTVSATILAANMVSATVLGSNMVSAV